VDEERLCRTAAVVLGVPVECVRVHVNDSCWSAWSPVGSVHVKTDRRDVPVSYTACSNDGAIGRHVPEKDAAWAMTQGMSLAVQAMRRAAETRDRVIDVSVILSVEKLVQRAEMKLLVAGREIFAEATHTDLYAAVDTLIDKLDRQVIKHKQKRQNYSGSALKRMPEPA